MALVKDVFKVAKVTGDLGLEIEVEGKNLPSFEELQDIDLWRADKDGSLKDGMEYVLVKPVSLIELDKAIDDLLYCFRENKTKIEPSFRAGIHLHVNVQNLTTVELINFICAYFVVESLVVNWCDPTRVGNHFCFRASDAEYLVDCISRMVETGNLRHIDTDKIRYSAFNIRSLKKYGSVEIRALESTLDKERILQWAGMHMHIKEKSKLFQNPAAMMQCLSVDGLVPFAKIILGPYYDTLTKGVINLTDTLRDGANLSQEIAFSRDWVNRDLNIFKKESNLFS